MDASIILAGQPIDFLGSMARGNELAAQTNQLRDQNALRQVYRTQGAGIMSGNQQSLNALAAIDPAAALGAQGSVLQNRTAERQLQILNAEEQRAIAEAARQMDEAQRAAAMEATKREVFRFIAAPSPEVFDMLVTQAGKPELRGQWANRQILGADYVSSVEEALKLGAGPEPVDPTKGAPSGYMFINPNNPAAGVAPLPGYQRSSGVTINTGDTGPQLGTVPQGYAVVPAPGTEAGYRMVAIPGGPEDTTAKTDRTKVQGQLKLGTTLENLNLNIKDVEDGGLPVTGVFGDLRRTIVGRLVTGDSAMNFGNRTNQITDSAALAEVQNMRDNSPTGGAVGSLTDDERRAIGNAVTSLNNSTDAEEYVRAAKNFRKLALDLAYGEGTWELDASGAPRLKAAPAAPTSNIPPGAIDLLKQNDTPDYRRSFDEIFGPGAAASVLGGN